MKLISLLHSRIFRFCEKCKYELIVLLNCLLLLLGRLKISY